MKGFLVTMDECQPCSKLKEELSEQLQSGEIEEVNFNKEPEKATEMINKYGLGVPGLVILANNGEVLAVASGD